MTTLKRLPEFYSYRLQTWTHTEHTKGMFLPSSCLVSLKCLKWINSSLQPIFLGYQQCARHHGELIHQWTNRHGPVFTQLTIYLVRNISGFNWYSSKSHTVLNDNVHLGLPNKKPVIRRPTNWLSTSVNQEGPWISLTSVILSMRMSPCLMVTRWLPQFQVSRLHMTAFQKKGIFL